MSTFFLPGGYCPLRRPIAFWPLNKDSKLTDVSGYGHDASGSDVTLAQGPNKMADSAYEFYGRESSFLTITPTPVLEVGFNGSFTYCAYIYSTKETGAIMDWNLHSGYGLYFWLWRPNNMLTVYVPDRSTATVIIKSLPFTLNSWHFVAASYSYEDGTLIAMVDDVNETWSVPKVHAKSNSPFVYIGRRVFNDAKSWSPFLGKMSSVMLFNQALTLDDLKIVKSYSLDTQRIRKMIAGSVECKLP